MQPAHSPWKKEAKKELAEGQLAELPQPLEKKKRNKQPNTPVEKWQKKTNQPLGKKAEASNKKTLKKKKMEKSGNRKTKT